MSWTVSALMFRVWRVEARRNQHFENVRGATIFYS